MYHLSPGIHSPILPHPDRFSPRELTLIELWRGWDPSLDHLKLSHNIGVHNTVEHILPEGSTTENPFEYPIYRTDFYTQTTLQLNTHHNRRANQLLQMRDLLDIPLEKYADIDVEHGGNRFKQFWDKTRAYESVMMILEEKWYTAAQCIALGNISLPTGRYRESIYPYIQEWFTFLPVHYNAFAIDDPRRYTIAST